MYRSEDAVTLPTSQEIILRTKFLAFVVAGPTDDGLLYLAAVPEQRVIYNEGGDPKDGLRVAYYFDFRDEYPPEDQAYVASVMEGAVNLLRRSVRVWTAVPTTPACRAYSTSYACHSSCPIRALQSLSTACIRFRAVR